MYLSLFASAFLAATILPGTSEALFVLVLRKGGGLAAALSWATAGNVLGAATCYYLGRLGWSQRWADRMGVSRAKVASLEPKVRRWGPALGLLAWLPVVGDPFVVALGYFRAPAAPTLAFVAAGKLARYAFLAGVFA